MTLLTNCLAYKNLGSLSGNCQADQELYSERTEIENRLVLQKAWFAWTSVSEIRVELKDEKVVM